jgi:hypothetical protein
MRAAPCNKDGQNRRTVCHPKQEPDPVSIASLQSNPWASSWAASAGSTSASNAPWSAAPAGPSAGTSTSAANGPWSGQNATGTNATDASPANPLQSLASDIQAMLIQAQSNASQSSTTGGTTSTGSTTASATSAATSGQSLATALQTIMSDIQSAIAPATQTANADPTAPAGETGHHHHHHHGGGGEATGATDVAGTSTPSATSAPTQLATDQSVSSVFASGIAQAIQAYAGGSVSAAMPALTV